MMEKVQTWHSYLKCDLVVCVRVDLIENGIHQWLVVSDVDLRKLFQPKHEFISRDKRLLWPAATLPQPNLRRVYTLEPLLKLFKSSRRVIG